MLNKSEYVTWVTRQVEQQIFTWKTSKLGFNLIKSKRGNKMGFLSFLKKNSVPKNKPDDETRHQVLPRKKGEKP